MSETINEVEALIHELNETRETLSHMIFSCEYKITEKILVEAYENINAKLEQNKNTLNWLKSEIKDKD